MRSVPFAALGTFAVSACGILGIGADERTLEVAAWKRPCVGIVETLCLQVREPGATEFGNMFETPAGFDYEWGFDYVIVVEEREVENPPADGSSIRRTLESIESRRPVAVGTEFQLAVPTEAGLQTVEPGRWRLFHGPEVFCAEASACDGLAEAIAEHARLLITLRFPDVPATAFEIVGWSACAEPFGPCVEPS